MDRCQPLVGLMLLVACASTLSLAEQGQLRDAAALDHGCPRERVELIGESHDPEIGDRYEVDVCGRIRKYLREDDRFVDSTTRARARDRRDDHREKVEAAEGDGDAPVDHAPPEEE